MEQSYSEDAKYAMILQIHGKSTYSSIHLRDVSPSIYNTQ